jgi:glycosyltransferase involved in cell wall biosynthesis
MISVIVPTRDRLGFLREAVASVRSQSLAEWELIVVDDASGDGTWEWLESLEDKRVRPLRIEGHHERSSTRNSGLDISRGEFVLFLDDDDFLFDLALARLLEAVREHESAVAAVGARMEVRPGPWRRVPHPWRGHLRDTWGDVMFGWTPQCGQALLRRAAVMQAGGWRDRFIPAEDHDLWAEISQLGPVALIPEVVLGYRIHAGQATLTGASSRALALRRASLAKLEKTKQARAGQAFRALRHSRIASRSLWRARYGVAFRHCWLAVQSAPWLLGSPLSRPEIAGNAARSFVGLAFGDRAVRGLRRWKRIMAGVFRKRTASREFAQAAVEIERPEAP